MPTVNIPVASIKAVPLIHTQGTRYPASAWVEPVGSPHTGTGPRVEGLSQAAAWESMCSLITGISARRLPFMADTKDRLHQRYQQAQMILGQVVSAKRTLGKTQLEALINRDGEAAREAVLDGIGEQARRTLAANMYQTAANEELCIVAIRDAVRHAAEQAAHGALAADELRTLDAEIMASSEARNFYGSAIRAMTNALNHRLTYETGVTCTLLGQWSYGGGGRSIVAQLSATDTADPAAFAERVVAHWSADLPGASCRALLGLRALSGVNAIELT